MKNHITRKQITRPIVVATIFTSVAEFALLLYYGIYLSHEGSLLDKIIWTMGFCGLGMGLALGGLINLFLVGRVTGAKAILWTTLFAFTTLGIACNWLCMNLDRHFRYFGGAENPFIHFLPSFFAAALGGWFMGWLLFTEKGEKLLDRFRL